jgi:hypothetical protein
VLPTLQALDSRLENKRTLRSCGLYGATRGREDRSGVMLGYEFTRDDLPKLIDLGYYPEQPQPESRVIRDFLIARGADYDRFIFSARVGEAIPPDPDHLPGVQKSTVFSSMKRIDLIAWQGPEPTIIEAKIRVSTDALGKALMYRELFLRENPDATAPRLVVIGRFGDPDVLASLSTQGVDVYLYETDSLP